MKKKYILSLVVIGIMFLFVLMTGTGYGLWLATNDTTEKASTTLHCFKVYFSGSDTIEMRNIDSVINEEGIEVAPNTLTITNICQEKKELQVRLNILEETTVDVNALTIYAAGNIERDITLYKNLSNAKSTEEGVLQSKIIGLVNVLPGETVRTNIKMWFDEKKAPNIEKDLMLKARFELIDTESSVKASFADYLITNTSAIEKKGNPNFSGVSTIEEGMYAANTDEGKTYYYRGVVNNNYVKFAGLMWRIVRVNSDGTVRLVLDKSSGYMKYSDYVNYMDYVGYNYLFNGEMIHNKANDYLINWYNETIVNKGFDMYVVDSVGFLSADEVVLAGGYYGTNNQNYYLYNGENFFTGTPAEYYYYNAYMFMVSNTGALQIVKVTDEYGIRPVISLNSTVTVSGSGTISDPYTID